MSSEAVLATCVESVWEEHFAADANEAIAKATEAAKQQAGIGGGSKGRGRGRAGRGGGSGGSGGSGGRSGAGQGDARGGGTCGRSGGNPSGWRGDDTDANSPSAGASAEVHTSSDAARALRDWIIKTNGGRALDPRKIAGFFPVVPWAAPLIKAAPPSTFCAENAAFLRFTDEMFIEPVLPPSSSAGNISGVNE